MPQMDDLSRSLTAFDQDSTLVAVFGKFLKSSGAGGWLVLSFVVGRRRT